MTAPRDAPDLAVIEARAAAATHAAREYRYCRDCGAVDPPEETHGEYTFHVGCRRSNALTGGADAVAITHGIVGRGTVLDLIADNATLLAALRTERAAREAAEARHAALAGAVRAYLDAVDAYDEDDYEDTVGAISRDRERLDALLAGAPCGYVPARPVRAYLAAVEAARVEADPPRRAPDGSVTVDVALRAARTALDAALAAATTTPKESP